MAPRVADIKNKTTGERQSREIGVDREPQREREGKDMHLLSIRDTRPLPQSAVAVTFCVFVAVNNMSILSGNCGRRETRNELRVTSYESREQVRRDTRLRHMSHDGSTNKLQLFRACF